MRKKGKFLWEQEINISIFIFMLTCEQMQFKDSTREIEQQVKHYFKWKKQCKSSAEKEIVCFKKKPCTVFCFFPVNTE